MKFVKASGESFDWFCQPFAEEEMAQTDVAFWPGGRNFEGDITGYRFWVGTAQFAEPREKGPDSFSMTRAVLRNHDKAQELGATFLYETSAQYLLQDGARVTGLIAKRRDGTYIKITAAKGVILAAGGFGNNKEMCDELLTDIKDLMDEGDRWMSMDRDGRGIQMGVWAGGRLEPRPLSTMGGNFLSPTCNFSTFGPLWLDPDGKRFCNEMFGDTVFTGNANALCPAGKYGIVYDSTIFDNVQSSPPAHMAFDCTNEGYVQRAQETLDAAVKAGAEGFDKGRGGMIYAADTLPELADRMGYTGKAKENFLASIERYNELAKAGRDEDFGKDSRVLFPIEKAPFYGETTHERTIGMLMVTTGGLLTDEDQRVLNAAREPIPGLFATGNCCGRRFGVQYSTPIPGVSIGIAMTLGRLVGYTAAQA
jgi:succinate dehydrogenase/fumarate reductase flavoprotein subunit